MHGKAQNAQLLLNLRYLAKCPPLMKPHTVAVPRIWVSAAALAHLRGRQPSGGTTLNMATCGCFFRIFVMYSQNGLLNSSFVGRKTGVSCTYVVIALHYVLRCSLCRYVSAASLYCCAAAIAGLPPPCYHCCCVLTVQTLQQCCLCLCCSCYCRQAAAQACCQLSGAPQLLHTSCKSLSAALPQALAPELAVPDMTTAPAAGSGLQHQLLLAAADSWLLLLTRAGAPAGTGTQSPP